MGSPGTALDLKDPKEPVPVVDIKKIQQITWKPAFDIVAVWPVTIASFASIRINQRCFFQVLDILGISRYIHGPQHATAIMARAAWHDPRRSCEGLGHHQNVGHPDLQSTWI